MCVIAASYDRRVEPTCTWAFDCREAAPARNDVYTHRYPLRLKLSRRGIWNLFSHSRANLINVDGEVPARAIFISNVAFSP